MKNNRRVSLFLVVIILLSSSLIVFANDEDDERLGYDRGYIDGLIKGNENTSNKKEESHSSARMSRDAIKNKYKNELKDRNESYFYIGYIDGFQQGYEENYRYGDKDPSSANTGTNYASSLATLLGEIYGFRDYHNGLRPNWSKACPSNTNLSKMYDLKNQTSSYRSSFYSQFRVSFKKSYETAYEKANLEPKKIEKESSYADGKAAGLAKGELQANHDYLDKNSMNWEKNKILSSEIIREYNLIYQSLDYKDGFVDGFLNGFIEGYNGTYNKLSQDYIVEKSIVAIIPKSGGSITTKDGDLTVEIEKGTFYEDVSISIETISDSNYRSNSRFIKTSKLYNIEITNKTRDLKDDNKIKLTFKYFDDYRGGVYKKLNNKFTYINSRIEGDSIVSYVNPNTLTFKNNIYCVQIDKDTRVFPDARRNWASEEIDTMVRRNIIYGYSDGYFRPDSNVSRAEFLTLLSRIYDWKLKVNKNIQGFKDYEKFGDYSKVISYAIANGYIKGYDDNTFKPNNPISYREVEIIMDRVLKPSEFKWEDIATKMMYEKQKKSSSYNNLNNNANRAEILYMIYVLNEWRY